MSRLVTDTTVEWAREAMYFAIENLLDDPNGVEPNRDDLKAYIRQLRFAADDLGLNFDALCAKIGTEFERERLAQIEGELA